MNKPCHALVFRDVRDPLRLQYSITALAAELRTAAQTDHPEKLLSALLRAGELESFLSDQNNLCMEPVTDALANAITGRKFDAQVAEQLASPLERLGLSGEAMVSRPEGFAFYGLSPRNYSDAARELDWHGDETAVVIGIRSIGTTLSAVVTAALSGECGLRNVQRFTVRPTGHPYDRRCEFSDTQKEVIRQNPSARFVIVDEGPGLSGSSFLSVGEALVEMGIAHAQVVFLCSREVKPLQLVTTNGAERWKRFATKVVQRRDCSPADDAEPLFAGAWRNKLTIAEQDWPGIWTHMSRLLYRSTDGRYLYEYVGLGHYGDALVRRANILADGGFTVPVTKAINGFSRSEWINGRPLSKDDLSSAVLHRVAEYIAFRAKHMAVPIERLDTTALEQMTRFNLQQALGMDLPEDFHLEVARPVIADGHMMPHEWIQSMDGGYLLKIDCAAHGDGHFFPGPVDLAWDLAGTIIEWELDADTGASLMECYEFLSGDYISERIGNYLVAYAAFRNCYCRMAASAMAHDPGEQERLTRDAQRYCEVLERLAPAQSRTVAAYE